MAGSEKNVACNNQFALWGHQQSLEVVTFRFAENQAESFTVIVMVRLVMRCIRETWREIFE